MVTHARWARWLRIATLAILAAIACLAAYVPIQQRILRWRAEQLLADIHEIQMGNSTWADAQRLMHRWGRWGGYQNECDERYCSFEVSIDDVSHTFKHFPFEGGGRWEPHLWWPTWMYKPYVMAGGRFAVVRAKVEVRNGRIWAKSFAVRTAFSSRAYSNTESYAAPDSNLIGEALCTTSLALGRSPDAVYSIDHPEVSLSLGDEDRQGHWAMAAFTPFASQNMVNALLSFNLDCITRRRECRAEGELMPTATSIYRAGKSVQKEQVSENYLEHLPLWLAAREAEYVATADVTGKTRPQNGQPGLSFRLKKLLKGFALVSNRSSVYMVRTEGSTGFCSIPSGDARNLREGMNVLVVFDETLNEESTPKSEVSACVVQPLTEENIDSAERGIARYSVLYPATYGP